jgi:hypothetical protein
MCDEGEGVRVRRITRRKPTVASVRHPEASATVTAKSAGSGTAPSIAAGGARWGRGAFKGDSGTRLGWDADMIDVMTAFMDT